MRKFSDIFKPYMIRPILKETFARLVSGIVFSFLWMRFAKVSSFLTVFEYPFFFLGFLYFALAWLNYLKLDGMRFPAHLPNVKMKKKTKHHSKRIIDFLDTEPSEDSRLSENEEFSVRLSANILAAFCFILPSFIVQLQ